MVCSIRQEVEPESVNKNIHLEEQVLPNLETFSGQCSVINPSETHLEQLDLNRPITNQTIRVLTALGSVIDPHVFMDYQFLNLTINEQKIQKLLKDALPVTKKPITQLIKHFF